MSCDVAFVTNTLPSELHLPKDA